MSLFLSDVAIDVADRTLARDVQLRVAPGERLALVGANGVGKSTLLRVIVGELAPSRGGVRVDGDAVHVPQLPPPAASEATLLAAILAERPEPVRGVTDAALRSAGLDPAVSAGALSGGERQRARLAAAFAASPALLALDEPTNHLDADGVAWLIGALHGVTAAVVVVDHDRAFLDAVAVRTAFLEHGALRVYPGGYTEADAARRADDAAQRRRHESSARHHAALRDAADRARSRARSAGRFDHRRADGQATILVKNRAEAVSRAHARAAAAMRTRLERERPAAKPFEDRTRLAFRAGEGAAGPNDVLRAEALDVARDGRLLVRGLDLALRRGDRLVVRGANGAGKSTLLATFAGVRPPSGGTLRWADGLHVAYVAQGTRTDGSERVGEVLRAERADLADAAVWELMAGVGVPCGPDRSVATLSGGERRRLDLARLAVTEAQLLVLDEPTLHLDVRAIEALESLLVRYAGTLVVVSHDAALVGAVGGSSLDLDGDGGWGMG